MSRGTQKEPFHVAIIGGGITGVNLALGLQARGVSYTIYERGPGFREIGAGIAFSPNAERAMNLLNPDVLAAFKRVANPNGDDYFRWVDGYETNELIFKLYIGKDGFQGSLRSAFLDEWSKQISPSAVQFNKHLDTFTELTGPDSPSNKVLLHFTDGTTATADAVVGCDGIRSRVRQLLLARPPSSSLSLATSPSSELPPAAHPTYTQKFCFRALAPMTAALSALGRARASSRHMYNGPGAHLLTYPVGDSTLLNILAVLSDPSPTWPHPHHTATGNKAEVVEAFAGWSDAARAIVDLLPDADGGKMDKWGIFDMAADPAPRYHGGKVCLAGDAAHATGPHLGAGAGLGVEDALVLGVLLAEVDKKWREGEDDVFSRKGEMVEKAFEVYNEVRYDRTQEVVQSTRKTCDLFQWRDSEVGEDSERFGREITARFYRVWDYDVNRMVEEALAKFSGKL
ncbi:hypothetical protein P885DRAFT_44190 [Corynascus similis CBS 632.67]